jgi:putative membrane protein
MSDLNDPRVLFAAERTLLAWSRTSLTLMGFGFLIERFGLFLRMLTGLSSGISRDFSFWVGIVFIVLGVALAGFANRQFRQVIRTLKPTEIPAGYLVNLGVVANIILMVLGIALIAYLIHGFRYQ